MMITENYVIDKINSLCKERGWTKYRLAKEAGIAHSTLHNMMHNTVTPTVFSISKICDAFGITLSQFFAEEGIYELTVEQKNLLDSFDKLDLHEKKIAVAFIDGMAIRNRS